MSGTRKKERKATANILGGIAEVRVTRSAGSTMSTGSKKYKFHAEYLDEVVDDGDKKRKKRSKSLSHSHRKHHKKLAHPEMDNDSFWEHHYKIVNYRRQHPGDFDEAEFQQFYDWLSNLSTDDKGQAKTLLFATKKKNADSQRQMTA
uniref:Uncharacterized protein n=1 Tax=Plectus sambesii TaxID=2011161 RepID=A0A914VTP6_9BILA